MRWLLLFTTFLAACDAPGTGGAAITVHARVAPKPAGPFALGDALVSLHRAELSVAGFYVLDQPPPVSWWQRALRAVGPGVAQAHGGDDFFAGGRVLSEWIHPVVVDLLAPVTELGPVPGIAGVPRSVTVLLWPSAALDGRSLRLEGTVSRGGVSQPFEVSVTLDAAPELQRVDFARADGELQDGGSMSLVPDVVAWFSGGRFSDADVGALTAESEVVRAVRLNLRRHSSWSLRGSPPGAQSP